MTNLLYALFSGEVIFEKYSLEYGTDCLELHVGAVQPGERAIVIDDLVATGGTLSAGIRLLGVDSTRFCQYSFALHYLTHNCSMYLVLVPNILYVFFPLVL
jgi:hypothetical protein